MKNKIIVSSIGYNSVHGIGPENYWKQFEQGQSFDSCALIEDVDPHKYLNSKGQKFLNRASLIYCNIAFQCIHNRGLLEYIKANPDRVGLYDSSELSNLEACFQFDIIAKNEGPDYVSPMNAPNTIANAAASQMAIQAGVKGPNFTVCAGALGSLQALDIASMHLNQNITDYAIVGSTEVINKYQTAIRRGEHRNPMLDSSEQGVALLLERTSDVNAVSQALAVLERFSSGTQMPKETKEDLIWRLIRSVIDEGFSPDLCVLSGGSNTINELKLNGIFAENNFDTKIVYPEKHTGVGDNAGGTLGVVYAIGIFKEKIFNDAIQTSGPKIKNILVLSADSVGGASVCLVSNPKK